jgi:hypothetical protein
MIGKTLQQSPPPFHEKIGKNQPKIAHRLSLVKRTAALPVRGASEPAKKKSANLKAMRVEMAAKITCASRSHG